MDPILRALHDWAERGRRAQAAVDAATEPQPPVGVRVQLATGQVLRPERMDYRGVRDGCHLWAAVFDRWAEAALEEHGLVHARVLIDELPARTSVEVEVLHAPQPTDAPDF